MTSSSAPGALLLAVPPVHSLDFFVLPIKSWGGHDPFL